MLVTIFSCAKNSCNISSTYFVLSTGKNLEKNSPLIPVPKPTMKYCSFLLVSFCLICCSWAQQCLPNQEPCINTCCNTGNNYTCCPDDGGFCAPPDMICCQGGLCSKQDTCCPSGDCSPAGSMCCGPVVSRNDIFVFMFLNNH